MASVTHLYGRCLSLHCSKVGDGCCNEFAVTKEGNECDYCNCHRSAHHHYGFLAPDGSFHGMESRLDSDRTSLLSKKVFGGKPPVLKDSVTTKAERVAIFRSAIPTQPASSPLPKSTKKRGKSSSSIMCGNDAVSKKAKIGVEDTEQNRKLDRIEALKEAPQGCTRTDLDLPENFKVNHETWVPPVSLEERAVVTDFQRYCFTCYNQNPNKDRDFCYLCSRWCFVDCGSYPEQELGDFFTFACCFCSNHQSLSEEFNDYVESLPPRISTLSHMEFNT